MITRKQFLDVTKLTVDGYQSRERRNQIPHIYINGRDYSLRDALLTMVSLQLSGAMGVSNDRAYSIAVNCDGVLTHQYMEALRDPRIDRPTEAIFIGRVVVDTPLRLRTKDTDTGNGSAKWFCGTMEELSASLASLEMVVNFQIVNLTNIANHLRDRCNEENVPYSLLFEG